MAHEAEAGSACTSSLATPLSLPTTPPPPSLSRAVPNHQQNKKSNQKRSPARSSKDFNHNAAGQGVGLGGRQIGAARGGGAVAEQRSS